MEDEKAPFVRGAITELFVAPNTGALEQSAVHKMEWPSPNPEPLDLSDAKVNDRSMETELLYCGTGLLEDVLRRDNTPLIERHAKQHG